MSVVQDLERALPDPSIVTTAGDARVRAARDAWPRGLIAARDGAPPVHAPAAVVRARSENDVVATLKWAHAARVPVVPRGAGWGVLGAAVPGVEDAIVLDVSGLDHVSDPDPVDRVVRVGPGVIGSALEAHLEKHGVTSGHHPQSNPLSSVGGFVATRASGQSSTLYGNIEDLVVALRVVLPDGRVLETPAWPRASTGPDLKQLFLGAEGALGVVTEVTLKVFPLPERTEFLAFAFDDFERGLTACRRIMHRGARPGVLRLHDATDASLALAEQGVPDADAGNILLAVAEGDAALVGATTGIVASSALTEGARDLGSAPTRHWWEHRYSLGEKLTGLIEGGMVVDTLDVTAPWSRLPRVHDTVIAAAEDADFAAMGHASHFYATGANLYFTFLAQGGVPDHERAWNAMLAATRGAGAGVAHHHGVGIARKAAVEEELGPVAVDVLRAVKRALDPHGIMNPGKLL